MTNLHPIITAPSAVDSATKKRRSRPAVVFWILCLFGISPAFADDDYYVVKYYSVMTDSGIIGLKPGTHVVVYNRKDTTFKYGDQVVAIPWQYLSEKQEDGHVAAVQDTAEQDVINKKNAEERAKSIAQEQARLKALTDRQAEIAKKLKDAQKQQGQ